MVKAMSSASAPISIAKPISPNISPALIPTIAPPKMRCESLSKISLVIPSVRPEAIARPDAAHGKVALSTFRPCSLASFSVTPTHAISGSV